MIEADRTIRCGVVPAIQELPRPFRMPFPSGDIVSIITPDEDDESDDESRNDETPREDRYPPRQRIPRIPNLH